MPYGSAGCKAVSPGGMRATGDGMKRALMAVGLSSMVALLWLGAHHDNFEGVICDPLWPEPVKTLELNPGQVRLYVKRSPWMTDNSTVGVFKIAPRGESATRVPVQVWPKRTRLH